MMSEYNNTDWGLRCYLLCLCSRCLYNDETMIQDKRNPEYVSLNRTIRFPFGQLGITKLRLMTRVLKEIHSFYVSKGIKEMFWSFR